MSRAADSQADYRAGFAAGLRWLETADGEAYLDPRMPDHELADPPYDRSRDLPGGGMAGPYNQGVIDAVKEVSWHRQHPGPCHLGDDCPAWAWLATHPPSQ